MGEQHGSMYAVFETGGKQYRVQPGDIVEVEKLEGDVGANVEFNNVLFAAKSTDAASTIWLGKPYLNGANVAGEIIGQGRGEKVTIVKMKRRKQYRRTQGHRQFQTQLLVTAVANGSGETATLSAADKKAKLASFRTNLTPKGQAFTPKTLGSRKRLAAAKAAGGTTATKKAAPKAAAPKAAAPKATTAKKAAPKKAAAAK
jgi:large subunit ribosomal protein L21